MGTYNTADLAPLCSPDALISGLDEEFLDRLVLGLKDYRLHGMCGVLAALRSYAVQAYLYNNWVEFCKMGNDVQKWKSKHPGVAVPNLAAKPGTSMHGRGLAVDLYFFDPADDTGENHQLVANVLWEYGLWQAVRDSYGTILEWWHFELFPNRYPAPPPNFVDPATISGAGPIASNPEEEEEEMKPITRIFGVDDADAQFIRFGSGEVRHLGPGEMRLYDEGGPLQDVPKTIETDRQAYFRLIIASGTSWRPADWPGGPAA